MPSQDIKMTVTAQNKASDVLAKIKKDISGLDDAAGKASGGLGAMGKALGVAGIVAFGAKVAAATGELAKMGAQSLALKSSFDQVQGGAANATAILESLRSASRGMISDYDLMLSANKAALLGVADTAEEMSGLLQIASVRGRAMGISATQAFNDIVTGLGRMSPLILDNLGITVDLEATTAKYAQTLGKSADALTDAERKQALVNAVMESSASLLESANASAQTTASGGFAQLNTAWTNFTTAIGESLAPALNARAAEVAAGVDAITDAIANSELRANKAMIAQQVQELQKLAQDAIVNSVAPGAPAFPEDLQGGAMSDSAQRMQLVLFAIQQVEQAQANNVEGSQQWAEQIGRIAQRTVELGSVSDKSLRQISILLGEISQSNADAKLQKMLDIMGEGVGNYASIPGATQAVKDMDDFTASFEAAAQAIGENESKLKGIFDTLLDTGDIEGASKAYSQIQGIIQEITAEWVRQGIPIETIENDLLPKLIGELDNLIGKQVEAGAAGITAGDEIGSGFLSSIPAIQLVVQAVNALTGAADTAAAAVGGATQGFSLNSWGWREFNATGKRPPGVIGPAPRGVEKPPEVSSFIQPGFGWWGLSAEEWGESSRGENERARLLAQAESRNRSLPSLSRSGGGGISSIDDELTNLTGRIKSVLSGALKSGIDVGALLPREDAVEEPARRLADIAVRGFESPWTEYIKTTFPEIWEQLQSSGDPKGAAASILRDFEAGLRPELLDKSRAKEMVKRALLGDANMSALASEIAAELSAEMGISLESAQNAAQSVLGAGTGSSGVGTAFGDGVAVGVKDSNAGGRAVAELVSQLAIKDNLTAVYNAGQTHGAQYGSGFLASVGVNLPGGLIAILVAAVTPGVLSNVNAQGGRTGANGASGSSGGAV